MIIFMCRYEHTIAITNRTLVQGDFLEQMKKVTHFIYTNGVVWRYYYNQKLKWEKNLGVSKTKYTVSEIAIDKNEFEELRKEIRTISWK